VGRNKWGRAERYKGEPRLIEKELLVKYPEGKTIFIEHMNDMFAEGVKDEWIRDILGHCGLYDNKYVFQTKNPERAFLFAEMLPPSCMMGTTIETNRVYPDISKAPEPRSRHLGMMAFRRLVPKIETFVTIEPIVDFDVEELVRMIVDINPQFVNIGADSKGCKLPEPTPEKVKSLIAGLQKNNITIKKKVNLGRMLA
jgi:protein gp37